MNNLLASWVDSRTGYRGLIQSLLYEHIPGGARWRYVWGSTLIFCFATQMITGLFLWMYYSPSAQTAWESVYYIQYEVAGGWLLRGIHHYTAQVMMVLLALHLMQVVIDGAYRAPREFNFWTGLVLLQVVMGLGLTGYLLPWDQKGYWATKVATNIMRLTPVVGDQVQRVMVGGAEYGHHTLTRFFALHAGVLPLLMIAFIGLHVYLFRRHSITYKDRKNPDSHFWPDQVLKDGVACLAVLGVVLFLCVQHRLFGGAEKELGAALLAPAEPSNEFSAARPEWYFLFLFQFLKYFKDSTTFGEVWGAIYFPGIVLGVVALMPFVGHWKVGHRFNVLFLFVILGGAGFLTAQALYEDSKKDDYKRSVAEALDQAERIRTLADHYSIPVSGAAALFESDPYVQGPRLFERYCSSCHRFESHDGRGNPLEDAPSAADLGDFASREWLIDFLDPAKISTEKFFGGTDFKDGRMARFVQEDVAEYDNTERANLVKVIKALSAEAGLISQKEMDAQDQTEIEEGRKLMLSGDDHEGGLDCVDCHKFHGEGRARGPDLTGYGSEGWLVGIISDPAHKKYYGKRNDRMPAFGEKEILDAKSIQLIAKWLRGDWFVPGGEYEEVSPDGYQGPKLPDAEKSEARADDSETPGGADSDEAPADGAGSDDETGVAAAVEEKPEVEIELPAEIEFVEKIQPILEVHCFKCHGGGKRSPKGDYSLKTKELAFTAGDLGEDPIIAGNSEDSLLYRLISSDDEDERMPPEGKSNQPLSPLQIGLVKAWIDGGAEWPDGVELQKASAGGK